MSVSVKTATLRDLTYLAGNLNKADLREITALTDRDIREVAASHLSDYAFVAWHKNKPVAAFGAAPFLGATYHAWLFGTKESWRAIPSITRFCQWLESHLADQGVRRIEARSIEGHSVAHRWLQRQFGCPDPIEMRRFGRNGETFLLFYKELSNVHQGT